MSNLPIPRPALFPSGTQRQVSRAFDQIGAGTAVAVRSDLARIERIVATTQRGMTAVTHIASVEATLSRTAPHAAERIHAVACAGSIGIVNVVHDAGMGF